MKVTYYRTESFDPARIGGDVTLQYCHYFSLKRASILLFCSYSFCNSSYKRNKAALALLWDLDARPQSYTIENQVHLKCALT